jgi:2',3'-cyclic-nucleotide 2'-phosphodiesterase (5'-nucleotidase family)
VRRSRPILLLAVVALLASLGAAPAIAAPPAQVSFTILHTNDFHGQLEPSGSNPGSARVATIVNDVRTAVGAANTLLVDAGDEMQGSLLSNLGDGTATGKGIPTIATFNAMGYNTATFGNHEFDWGQVNLANRTAQATYPFVTANIVQKGAGDCSAAGWDKPDFAAAPYQIKTVGTALNTVKVAFIGVTTTETPTITVSTATAGLCFKDPAESILHYYAAMKADGADVIVVLSHLGYADGGYGYGIPVYGDQTLATKLNTAGKPVNLIIGGHSHTNLTAATTIGTTKVVQAYYNGRRVGRADVTVGTDGSVGINWQSIAVVPPTYVNGVPTPGTGTPEDPSIAALIASYATNPSYLAIVNEPVGYSAVDLPVSNTGDNMMGTFIDDAIYNFLNTDAVPANDVDLFFNNAGGIRAGWCYVGGVWTNAGCVAGTHAAGLLTYGNMFTVLPFGNATVVGTMTGTEILDVLNHGPQIAGVIQPAGLKYKYYAYKDAKPGPQPFAWGAFDYCVVNKTTKACDPLDMQKTYKVGTNEFLAPAGGDGYNGFKYMKNITYWGDMLNAVNAYVSKTYGTAATAYKGPNGNGTLDGRITRDGSDTPNSGSIVPITILHNNDSHGNLAKGTYVGYTQLATLIKQEELHNPGRTLLLNAGDQIQGDAMMYYFKTSYSGKASDGTPLPASLTTNPMMAVMNALGYDAMTLGNHEFNFGSAVFQGVLGQAKFPILGANVSDTGAYGLAAADGGQGVKPYVEINVGGVKVAILGITNHRVPNYELPSNIPGLTFSDPIAAGQKYAPSLFAKGDVVVALTHIGFTENPSSVEVDKNVDTNFAAQVPGVDAIIGGHSHTDPSKQTAYSGDYKYLPALVGGPDNAPVLVTQAYRYNNYLGEVVLGVLPKMQLTVADVQAFWASKAIDNAGVKTSLLSKLSAIKASFDAGQTAMALSRLKAFISAVKAQSGKHITKAAADALIADANWMIANKAMSRVVASAGQYLTVTSTTPEDTAIKAIVDPYVAQLKTYQDKVIGQTTVPIDALQAFTQETNGANLQADASVYELAKNGITDVDVHLSGAMTNSKIAGTATPASPYTLKVSDMFTAMPYENSLVVISMNGPQIKAVLERGYRNYYYYKYVPGRGGYSYYTTCMIDTNSIGKITYNEKAGGAATPPLPDGNNVVSLTINGTPVNFADAAKYYNVSTVNYLAAGSCNFNDGGVTLWPLDQMVHDTQYYVRDAVIDYITHEGIVSPAIEGRLIFN